MVLAVATFSSVRSANRAARTAERALLVGLRPLLVQARLDDPVQKIHWADSHWTRISGSECGVEVTDDVVYLTLPLRNAGAGLAVLHGWHPQTSPFTVRGHAPPEEFRPQTRDLYVSPSDAGFWQGALRDRTDATFDAVAAVIQHGGDEGAGDGCDGESRLLHLRRRQRDRPLAQQQGREVGQGDYDHLRRGHEPCDNTGGRCASSRSGRSAPTRGSMRRPC